MVKTLSPPDVLLFHVGSNDLTSDTSAISFANTIQCTLYRYNALWPKTTLVWSSVLARRYWHHVALRDGPKINKKRQRLNRAMKKFMSTEVQGFYIDHDQDISYSDIQLFRQDGTHLSPLGNQVFLNNLQTGLLSCLTK